MDGEGNILKSKGHKQIKIKKWKKKFFQKNLWECEKVWVGEGRSWVMWEKKTFKYEKGRREEREEKEKGCGCQ